MLKTFEEWMAEGANPYEAARVAALDSAPEDEFAPLPDMERAKQDKASTVNAALSKASQPSLADIVSSWDKGNKDIRLEALQRRGDIEQAARGRSSEDMGQAGLDEITAAVSQFANAPQQAAYYYQQSQLRPGAAKSKAEQDEFGKWLMGRKAEQKERLGLGLKGAEMARKSEQAAAALEAAKAKAMADEERRKNEAKAALDKEQRGYAHGEKVARIAAGRQDAARAEAKGERTAKDVEEGAKDYGKTLGDWLPAISGSLGEINSLLEKHKGGDLPGVGLWDSFKFGKLNSADDRAMKRNLDVLTNALLRKETGAAIARNEEERKKVELGLSGTSSEADFVEAMKILNRNIGGNVEAAAAKYKPESIELYGSRGGMTPKKFSGAIQGAKVKVISPEGKQFMLPASQVEAARAKGFKVADDGE